jgi:hypothetical protein
MTQTSKVGRPNIYLALGVVQTTKKLEIFMTTKFLEKPFIKSSIEIIQGLFFIGLLFLALAVQATIVFFQDLPEIIAELFSIIRQEITTTYLFLKAEIPYLSRAVLVFSAFLLGFGWRGIIFTLKNIPRLINWLVVCCLIVLGLMLLITPLKGGFFLILAGLLISPYMSDFLNQMNLNYRLSTKMIVVLFGLVMVIVSLMYYETSEKKLLVGVLLYNTWIDTNNDEDLSQLRAYFDKEAFKEKKRAYLSMRNKIMAYLKYEYDNGHYKTVIDDGTPYVKFEPQIKQWVSDSKEKWKLEQLEIAVKSVPELMKADKYAEVYHKFAVSLANVPEIQESLTTAKKKLDQEVEKLQKLYVNGEYQKVIKTGSPDMQFDCRINSLVLDSYKVRVLQEIQGLMNNQKYQEAIDLIKRSEYAERYEFQKMIQKAEFEIKKIQERKILARLKKLPPENIEANILEYKGLLQLFPQSRKYQKKLKYYEKRLDEVRRQPPILITQEQYGDEWPFLVAKGVLECMPPGIITFKAHNKTYAVNGLANSRGYKDIDEIWKDDPKQLGMEDSTNIINKVDLGAIISKGLELCTPLPQNK